MDIIYLRGLSCPCRIGVWEWEKHITQTLTLDLEMATDARAPAIKDDLNQALDYQAVADFILKFSANNQFALLETFAERLSDKLMAQFGLPWLRLTVDKGAAVTSAAHVGLVIERGERETS